MQNYSTAQIKSMWKIINSSIGTQPDPARCCGSAGKCDAANSDLGDWDCVAPVGRYPGNFSGSGPSLAVLADHIAWNQLLAE